MKQMKTTELPERIQVTIPAEKKFSIPTYIDNEDCYLARQLKLLGYAKVQVFGSGNTFIEGLVYRPTEPFGFDTLEQNFNSGIDTTITLIRQN